MERTTYWDVHVVPKANGQEGLLFQRHDPVSKRAIGHSLTVDIRLFKEGVEIVIQEDGNYEITKKDPILDPVESGIIKLFRRRAA